MKSEGPVNFIQSYLNLILPYLNLILSYLNLILSYLNLILSYLILSQSYLVLSRSYLEQNLAPLRYLSVQIRAPLVMKNRFPVNLFEGTIKIWQTFSSKSGGAMASMAHPVLTPMTEWCGTRSIQNTLSEKYILFLNITSVLMHT